MNYKKIYNSIIAKAKLENRIKHNGIYYENHHILPISLKGENKKDNLVLLTAKEHFLAHKLLIKIYTNNRKLVDAFFFMIHGNQKQHYNASLRDYEHSINLKNEIPLSDKTLQKMRKHLKKVHEKNKGSIPWNKGLDAINKGVPTSEESKIKLSNTLKKKYENGYIHPMTGKTHSEETKKKISEAQKGQKHRLGKTHSEESKKKMSESHKGQIPWNKGKKASTETLEKMRKSRLGKPSPNKGKKYIIDKNGNKRIQH